MLGYGTVVVRGTGETPEPFETIAHPLEFRRQVQEQVELPLQGSRLEEGKATQDSPDSVWLLKSTVKKPRRKEQQAAPAMESTSARSKVEMRRMPTSDNTEVRELPFQESRRRGSNGGSNRRQSVHQGVTRVAIRNPVRHLPR